MLASSHQNGIQKRQLGFVHVCKESIDVSFEIILKHFPSNIAEHIRPSNVLSLLMKKTLPAVLLFLSFFGQWAMAQATGSIQGNVTDSSETPIFGVVVTVQGADGNPRTTVSDREGAFKISSLTLGNYSVKMSANGMSDWTALNVPALLTPESKPVLAVLQVAPEVTTVTVGLPPEEVAAEQLHQELKQRALGIIPNYYVTYENHPAPLSPKQKLHLGMKTLLDPVTIGVVEATAGIQQAMNSYHQFGQGAEGFGKRFGADYGTALNHMVITSVLADSVLHQDPRFFYSGQGTKTRRAWYAIESAFRAKGDNGKWQLPYADLIGTTAAAEISNIYYPGSRTQYTLLGRSLMFHFAGLVAVNLAEELFLKKATSNTPEVQSAANTPVLREGTAVPLIAVDGFSAETVTAGQTVTLVLAEDLTVRGNLVARTGDVASGQVGQVTAAKTPGDAMSVALQGVTLRAGTVNVPLRSSQVRGSAGPVQYKQLSESGKVEVTLFVAKNVHFPESQ